MTVQDIPLNTVSAVTFSSYTSAVEDLKTDENFDVGKYPAKDNDYSMEIIQIAESDSGELLIYIYQPAANSKQLKATTINLSTERDNLSVKMYKLQLLNRSGVFAKYRVEGFKVRPESTRYYDIPAMHRAYDKNIDGASKTDNAINGIAIEVAQSWTVVQNGDSVVYSLTKMDVITITHQWVGALLYFDGYDSITECSGTVSHFIGFSADYQIDKLIEADLSYVYYSVSELRKPFSGDLISRNVSPKSEPQTVTVKDDTSSNRKKLFGHSYTWKNIRSREQFCNEEDLTDEARQNLQDDDWVLTFAVTERTAKWEDADIRVNFDRIEEVTILRLKFETEGKPYNLGVVSNKQTADNKWDNKVENQLPFSGVKEWFKENKAALIAVSTIVSIVLVVVVVLVVMFLIRTFLPTGGGSTKITFSSPSGVSSSKRKKRKKKQR